MAKKKEKLLETSNSISYSGEVKIKLLRGKKVISTTSVKNNATYLMFAGMISYLMKNPQSAYFPNFIGIGTDGTQTTPLDKYELGSEIANSRNVAYVHAAEKTSTGYQFPLTAVFPSSVTAGKNIQEIGLFSDSNTNTMLARITAPIGVIDPKLTLLVEWTLKVENK